MKKMNSLREKFALILLLVPVIFLPSCGPWEWLKSKFGGSKATVETGPVLVSMKGQPVITMQSFDKEFEQLIEENPHLKSVLALMPDAKKNFLMGMLNQEVVDRWVTENHVDQKNEYKKELDRMMRSVKRMLNTKYFGVEHPVQVTDAEITEFYEKNKDSMPDLMISRGGVQAAGVSFESDSEAKTFLAKAKEMKDLKKAADASKLSKNYRDFKMVNSQSLGMDMVLRDKIAALETFPTYEIIKVNDKSFWVVNATAKEETKYRPFEQVKAGLEQFVAKEKRMEMLDKEINKLKTEYNVVINDDALKVQEPSRLAENEATESETTVAQNEQAPESTKVAQNNAPVETAKAA